MGERDGNGFGSAGRAVLIKLIKLIKQKAP